MARYGNHQLARVNAMQLSVVRERRGQGAVMFGRKYLAG